MTSQVVQISREYGFAAAHRIEGHPKCGRLHGHNYQIIVTLVSRVTRLIDGMVLDYGEMDRILKPYFDQFDHRYLYSQHNIQAADPYIQLAGSLGHTHKLDIAETTAEEFAKYFARDIARLLQREGVNNIFAVEIEVKEAPRSNAKCHLPTSAIT